MRLYVLLCALICTMLFCLPMMASEPVSPMVASWRDIKTDDEILKLVRERDVGVRIACSKQLEAPDVSVFANGDVKASDLVRGLAFSSGWAVREFSDGQLFLAPAGGGYLRSMVTGRARAAQKQSFGEALRWTEFAVETLREYHGQERVRDLPPISGKDLLAGYRNADSLSEVQRQYVIRVLTEADRQKRLSADVLRNGKLAKGTNILFFVGTHLGIYRPANSSISRFMTLPLVPYAPTDDTDIDASPESTGIPPDLSVPIQHEQMQLHKWYEAMAQQQGWYVTCTPLSRAYIVDFTGIGSDLVSEQLKRIMGSHPDVRLRVFGSVLSERNLLTPKETELPDSSGWAGVASDMRQLAALLDSLTTKQRQSLYDHEMRLTQDELTDSQRKLIDELVGTQNQSPELSLVKGKGLKFYIDFHFTVEAADANGTKVEVSTVRPFSSLLSE